MTEENGHLTKDSLRILTTFFIVTIFIVLLVVVEEQTNIIKKFIVLPDHQAVSIDQVKESRPESKAIEVPSE